MTRAQPTAYHQSLLEYLQTREHDLWTWFSSHKARSDATEAVSLELLKSAYRLTRETAQELYELADTVAEKMSIGAPVTLYQAQQSVGLNASLAWVPNEAHVVFHGAVQEALSSAELSALLAHELAHHELFVINDGDYLVMEQVLSAMISDAAAAAPHDRTWRSYRLYTELHCDRRAAEITGDIEACVCALVKLETGLKDVSAKAYLEQADEVLAGGLTGSEGITHPEMFIRAKALQLWDEDPESVDRELKEVVEGPLELQQMDLLRQKQVEDLTRGFLKCYLATDWLRTELMLGHAKRFFEDIKFSDGRPSRDQLSQSLSECDTQLRNYFCYVLLDFVTCDADLEEAPLAAAFLFSNDVGLSDEFRELAGRELRLGKRALRKAESDAALIVEQAEAELDA